MTKDERQTIDEILTYMIDIIIAGKSNYLSLESWYHDDVLFVEWGDSYYTFKLKRGHFSTQEKVVYSDVRKGILPLDLQAKVLHIYLKINGETDNYLKNYTSFVKRLRKKKLETIFKD